MNKIFEISLFAYSFQINFPNHYVSGNNCGAGHVSSKVKPVKCFWWGVRALHAPPPHIPPMLWCSPLYLIYPCITQEYRTLPTVASYRISWNRVAQHNYFANFFSVNTIWRAILFEGQHYLKFRRLITRARTKVF